MASVRMGILTVIRFSGTVNADFKTVGKWPVRDGKEFLFAGGMKPKPESATESGAFLM